ncbi:MAG TPA: 3-hydroxyacyl-ACP dehydratase FabZ family protein [Candidatus Krumholzibacteria bacterium]|nr:3-hydroxyacyl-ACP dehydratase FabZ family protein [Candidatus Krumholzibacteria bacterium]
MRKLRPVRTMRYILIDKIEYLEYHRRLRAFKNVSSSEDYFRDHFIGQPVMPGALIIETFAQAGTALLEISDDIRCKALLAMVERVKFRALVRPGDRLAIEVSVVDRDGSWVRTTCTARVGDKVVAEGALTFSVQESESFYPRDLRAYVEMGYRQLLEGATIEKGSS